jgi:hypothetical protein
MLTRLALIAMFFFFIPEPAKADTTWTYTGNAMGGNGLGGNAPGGCHCAIDGTFTLDASGDPTTWDFTDGTHTLTNLDSVAVIGLTQPAGWPLLWHINVFDSNVDLFSAFYGSGFEATDSSTVNGATFGYLEGNRGTLTESISTPEASSLILLGVGCLTMMFLFAGMNLSKTLNDAAPT